MPVGGAAATKLPAGGAHLGHCEIQDLTSESTALTHHPALQALPALTRRDPLSSQSVYLQSTHTERQIETIPSCTTTATQAIQTSQHQHSLLIYH